MDEVDDHIGLRIIESGCQKSKNRSVLSQAKCSSMLNILQRQTLIDQGGCWFLDFAVEVTAESNETRTSS